jgi:preprotein translocase subunit YajC
MLTIFLQAAPAQSMTPTLLMIGLMFVGFYFLMIRPQMRKQKQEKSFQEALKPGAKVVLLPECMERYFRLMKTVWF